MATFFRRSCAVTALAMIAYHFYFIIELPYEPSINAIIHLGLAFSVLLLANLSLRINALDLLGLIIAIGVTWYFFAEYDTILEDPSYPPSAAFVAGIASAALAFYLTYKVFGYIFPLIAVIGVAYLWFGSSMPGALRAPNMDFERMVT
ncbi:MAG: hypothetical protein ACI4P0_05910, partial [Mailhella sp.]